MQYLHHKISKTIWKNAFNIYEISLISLPNVRKIIPHADILQYVF